MRLGVDAAGEARYDDEPRSGELPAEAARDRRAVAGARASADDRDGRSSEKLGLRDAADEEPSRRIVDRTQQRREVRRRPRHEAVPARSELLAVRALVEPPLKARQRWPRGGRIRCVPVSDAKTASASSDTRELRPASGRRAPPPRARLAPSRTSASAAIVRATRPTRAWPRPERWSRSTARRRSSSASTSRERRLRGEPLPRRRDTSGHRSRSSHSARRQAPHRGRAASRGRGRSGRAARGRACPGTAASRCAEQLHCAAGSPRPPQGQRFIVATSMKRAGKTTRPAARETETKPSSSGWRSASSVGRWNSASSSRSSTPRCARLASPGRRLRAAADDRRGRGAVMRRAERRPRDERMLAVHEPGDRVDPRHLEGGVGIERRQDPRQPAREHRLPRPGRAAEEDVVPARRRQLERAPGALLPADVREVGRRRRAVSVRHQRRFGLQLALAAQVRDGLCEVTDRDRGDAGESCFSSRVRRTQESLGAEPPRTLGDGEDAADPAQPAVERELADRGVPRARCAEAAATPRATRARSAGRSRSPPCAAPPERG